MKKIYKLFLLTLIFTLCLGCTVFADISDQVLDTQKTIIRNGQTLSYSGIGSVYFNNGSSYYTGKGVMIFSMSGYPFTYLGNSYENRTFTYNNQTIYCNIQNMHQISDQTFQGYDVFTDVKSISMESAFSLLLDSLGEEFVIDSPSTLEGFNELGFVGGWGTNSSIFTYIDSYTSDNGVHQLNGKYSGVIENVVNFQSFDAPVQNGSVARYRSTLNLNDYEELFIQVSFKGVNSLSCYDRNSSISIPNTNNRLIFPETIDYFSGNSSYKLENADLLPLLAQDSLLSAMRYNYRTWKNDFTLGARFVALKNGHYIYGPWTDDTFSIDGNNIDTVPEYPDNTIKKTTHKVTYSTPTEDTDITVDVNTNTTDIPVYYPQIKIVEGDVIVNVDIPDINSNLAQGSVNQPSNIIDSSAITSNTQSLLELCGSVPSALASLFGFLPTWVLTLFAVVLVILLVLRILD